MIIPTLQKNKIYNGVIMILRMIYLSLEDIELVYIRTYDIYNFSYHTHILIRIYV